MAAANFSIDAFGTIIEANEDDLIDFESVLENPLGKRKLYNQERKVWKALRTILKALRTILLQQTQQKYQ